MPWRPLLGRARDGPCEEATCVTLRRNVAGHSEDSVRPRTASCGLRAGRVVVGPVSPRWPGRVSGWGGHRAPTRLCGPNSPWSPRFSFAVAELLKRGRV